MNPHTSIKPLSRIFWKFIGLICVGLAMIGVVLPLMPTTVFLIIAAYAFARSSPKLHSLLMNNKIFGPIILQWQEHGVISRRAKFSAVSSMVILFGISLWLKVPFKLLALQVIILCAVAYFIVTRPSLPRAKAEK